MFDKRGKTVYGILTKKRSITTLPRKRINRMSCSGDITKNKTPQEPSQRARKETRQEPPHKTLCEQQETPRGPRRRVSCTGRLMIGLVIALVLGHLLITLLDAKVFHGPCVDAVMTGCGPGQLEIDSLEYRIVPESNEIVMTWTESVTRRTLPFGKAQIKTPGETFEHNIPLDPLPPELARCYLDVTVAPDARPVGRGRHMNTDCWIPCFLLNENDSRTEPEKIKADQRHDLPSDMVFHMRVRPEDLDVLSHEFLLSATPGHHITVQMFPTGVEEDGRRVMYMTRDGSESRLYWDKRVEPRIEAHRNLKPTPLQKCWRLICLPVATLGDEILLAVFLFMAVTHLKLHP